MSSGVAFCWSSRWTARKTNDARRNAILLSARSDREPLCGANMTLLLSWCGPMSVRPDNQLVVDGEGPDHGMGPELGLLPVGVAVDDAEQRDVTVPHDDVDLVTAGSRHAWEVWKPSDCVMAVRGGCIARDKVVGVNALKQGLSYPIVLCRCRQWLYLGVDSNHAIHSLDGGNGLSHEFGLVGVSVERHG